MVSWGTWDVKEKIILGGAVEDRTLIMIAAGVILVVQVGGFFILFSVINDLESKQTSAWRRFYDFDKKWDPRLHDLDRLIAMMDENILGDPAPERMDEAAIEVQLSVLQSVHDLDFDRMLFEDLDEEFDCEQHFFMEVAEAVAFIKKRREIS